MLNMCHLKFIRADTKKAAFGMPPEPGTVPTYDLDGIAIRIPALSIPDQGIACLSLALNKLVEIFSECLDRGSSRRFGKRLELALTEICIATNSIAFFVPLLKENILRIVEKIVPNIVSCCHFYSVCV